MQVLALSADLNNSGRRPSRRVPLRREVSATPGESWGARTHVLVSCGGSCKGVRCGAALRPGTGASIADSSHRVPSSNHLDRKTPSGSPKAMGKRRRLRAALLVATTIACPVGLDNGEVCSGHGACAEHVSKGVDETCVCDYGFSGPDCSLRLCPAARAWSDYASANNTAHAKHVECSNMGESRRPAVLRCLHAIDATRLRRTRPWVVSFSISRPFGPRRETAMLRAGPRALRERRSRVG